MTTKGYVMLLEEYRNALSQKIDDPSEVSDLCLELKNLFNNYKPQIQRLPSGIQATFGDIYFNNSGFQIGEMSRGKKSQSYELLCHLVVNEEHKFTPKEVREITGSTANSPLIGMITLVQGINAHSEIYSCKTWDENSNLPRDKAGWQYIMLKRK